MDRPSLRHTLASFIVSVVVTASAFAQGLPIATPESVGMSGARLQRLSSAMKRAVDEGKVGGVVTVVARKGKVVHYENFGQLDREKHVPMPKNAIFRIASMSKAITTTA